MAGANEKAKGFLGGAMFEEFGDVGGVGDADRWANDGIEVIELGPIAMGDLADDHHLVTDVTKNGGQRGDLGTLGLMIGFGSISG